MKLAECRTQSIEAREEAIDSLVEEAHKRGDIPDRMYWTLVYDFEIAPQTTNLSQLRQMGFELAAASSVTEEEISSALLALVQALARLDIYLLHTNHLTDRELYDRLEGTVLRELVRDLPAGCGVHEYIDMAAGEAAPLTAVTDRDRHLPRRCDS
ncbi:MAG: hypothetical protein EXS00_05220 [Phycisphaerales bacterium]|nr:hypothetical protein [Phycisphaerales bacterium]